jgi:hypothetical protein
VKWGLRTGEDRKVCVSSPGERDSPVNYRLTEESKQYRPDQDQIRYHGSEVEKMTKKAPTAADFNTTHTHTHTHTSIYMYVRMYVCMYVCMYIYVCISVCMYVYIYICIYLHIYKKCFL